MNKNISIILVLISIFGVSCFLYWKGELELEKASQKFVVLAFENTKLDCSDKSLDFFIENNREQETSYQISIIINDQISEKLVIEVPAQSKKTISPENEILEKICQTGQSNKYEILLKNKEFQQNIYKIINL